MQKIGKEKIAFRKEICHSIQMSLTYFCNIMEVIVSVDFKEMELESKLMERIAKQLAEEGYTMSIIKEIKREEDKIKAVAEVATLNK